MIGLKVVLAATVIGIVAAAVMLLIPRQLGVSAPRASGALASLVGQPTILAYAGTRVVDEKVEASYAAIFALGIIVKILLVQLLVAL